MTTIQEDILTVFKEAGISEISEQAITAILRLDNPAFHAERIVAFKKSQYSAVSGGDIQAYLVFHSITGDGK